MTDRELLQMALDALEHLQTDVEWQYKSPTRAMLRKVEKALRARLAQPPKDLELPLVRPAEFVKLIQGKENYWGIPVMRTEWPTPEPVIQARKEGDLIVVDLPQVPTGGGGISKDEQPEPEPVAVLRRVILGRGQIFWLRSSDELPNETLLYTAPPQRKWVGLTDAEYEVMAEQYVTNCYFDTLKYAKAIEAKLKEKNA